MVSPPASTAKKEERVEIPSLARFFSLHEEKVNPWGPFPEKLCCKFYYFPLLVVYKLSCPLSIDCEWR